MHQCSWIRKTALVKSKQSWMTRKFGEPLCDWMNTPDNPVISVFEISSWTSMDFRLHSLKSCCISVKLSFEETPHMTVFDERWGWKSLSGSLLDRVASEGRSRQWRGRGGQRRVGGGCRDLDSMLTSVTLKLHSTPFVLFVMTSNRANPFLFISKPSHLCYLSYLCFYVTWGFLSAPTSFDPCIVALHLCFELLFPSSFRFSFLKQNCYFVWWLSWSVFIFTAFSYFSLLSEMMSCRLCRTKSPQTHAPTVPTNRWFFFSVVLVWSAYLWDDFHQS